LQNYTKKAERDASSPPMCRNIFKENAAAPIAAMKIFTIFANGTAGTLPHERKAAAAVP